MKEKKCHETVPFHSDQTSRNYFLPSDLKVKLSSFTFRSEGKAIQLYLN